VSQAAKISPSEIRNEHQMDEEEIRALQHAEPPAPLHRKASGHGTPDGKVVRVRSTIVDLSLRWPAANEAKAVEDEGVSLSP
jgi:hypothetical protein